MTKLSLKNLKDKRIELIKAEIGALLFNLGKTHVGFWKEKGLDISIDEESFEQKYGYSIFKDYKKYFKSSNGKIRFKHDLNHVNGKLEGLFYNTYIELEEKLELSEIVYGDAGQNSFVKNIFFYGCENINSGIDKGSPNKQLEKFWISNAFSGFKKEVSVNMLDKQRICFLKKLSDEISKKNNEINEFSSEDWIELRNFIIKEIRNWYSHLLSDSRFPINDITLWDQAYMTASLFKASLAGISLENSKLQEYKNESKKIKWSILGVQYDKLGIAEKALKPHFVIWYRDKAEEVDDEVKRLIEIKYALGNEIFRDETGIYFIVPENIGEKSKKGGYNLELISELFELKKEIIEIFKCKFKHEVYPSIFATKPSRGIMNIAYLIEHSRENFLKSILSKDIIDKSKEFEMNELDKEDIGQNNYYGLCQICRFRKGIKREDYILCDECNEEKSKGIKNRIDKIKNETIWTGDLQDKNGRIALMTVKFELKEWLNGNMLNTCLINDIKNKETNYNDYLNQMKNTLLTIKKIKENRGDDIERYKEFRGDIKALSTFIQKIDAILTRYGNVSKTIENTFYIDYEQSKFKINPNSSSEDLITIIEHENFKNFIKMFSFEIFKNLANDAYKGCKVRKETIDDFFAQVFFEQIKGDRWESFIQNSPIKNKICLDNNKIEWNKLSDQDFDFLAEILLQFLLRKNPSPARFRRIWKTTKDFFSELKCELKGSMEIEKWRTNRLVWKDAVKEESLMKKEYTYNGLDFWVNKKGDVYLISSIEKAISIIGNIKEKNGVKAIKEKIEQNKTDWIKEFTLKDYYTKKETEIKLNCENAQYEPYSPYFSIIEPTPVSWQFIIPAQYVPNVIDKIQEKYKRDFKYVVGKLPLHIGVVIQDYKKPLYIGLKSLRKIRRDINNWDEIKKEIDYKGFIEMQKKYINSKVINVTNRPQDYYSFYPLVKEDNIVEGEYEFYICPDKEEKKKLISVDCTSDPEGEKYKNIRLEIYPNTFDFEFLDTNIRRNDIYYEGGKRILEEKSKRPFTWEEWEDYKKYKKYFHNNQDNNKLNQMISLLYSKIKDWEDNEESLKKFILSAFINIFELNDKNEEKSREKKDTFAQIFDENMTWNKLETLSPKDFKQLLWKFIDMYDFWHNALKEL